ncbi:hypothetical protein P9112_000148 [Eukaryota sp. TZLM1-RC]
MVRVHRLCTIVNQLSFKSSITSYSPYELMFGSDFSPRADPGKILETLESSTSGSTYINDIQSKFARLKKKQEEAELRQASKTSPREPPNRSQPLFPWPIGHTNFVFHC